MLLTPQGEPCGKIEKPMLLNMWARQLLTEASISPGTRPSIISAGIGKPTFPLSEQLAKSQVEYWTNILEKTRAARVLYDNQNDALPVTHQKIADINAAISYGDIRGDIVARTKMAKILTEWYQNKVQYTAENILFTVGGASGLHVVFEAIKRLSNDGRIVTQFPFYGLYKGARGDNNLHPINVMNEPGYRLTAVALKASLIESYQLAKIDGNKPAAFVLCDPNNPMGTLITEEQMQKIAQVLREYPDIKIILDEAYTEMRFYDKKFSTLLTVAPDLKNRIIVLRSATKTLSAAGERMAVVVVYDHAFMNEIIQEHVNICGHAPRSLQHAFAEAMEDLDEKKLEQLNHFYREQVEYVAARLKAMNAALPNPDYKVEGTFYVVGDFSDLLGLELPSETQKVLNKPLGQTHYVSTDEEIAYYLLFQDGIMITPLSYLGLPEKSAYLRITCSGGMEELKILLDRLEKRLNFARESKV